MIHVLNAMLLYGWEVHMSNADYDYFQQPILPVGVATTQ